MLNLGSVDVQRAKTAEAINKVHLVQYRNMDLMSTDMVERNSLCFSKRKPEYTRGLKIC